MYSCIGVTKVNIKTVSFRFNHTDDLSELEVRDIKPKQYATEESKPLWAAEKSGLAIADAKALWGLVSSEQASKTSNISTIRKKSLYLPGSMLSSVRQYSNIDNLHALDFAAGALNDALDISNVATISSFINYTGLTNFAVVQRWKVLSNFASGVATIFSLIWTNLVANGIVGTKTVITKLVIPNGVGSAICGRRESDQSHTTCK